ncbi:hypothetical protein X566_11620 [Afipia sp. P52-10]|jgi:hypothetical protein|nr:hypothetical protein X566_11620 [Afipia sp. P52-10]
MVNARLNASGGAVIADEPFIDETIASFAEFLARHLYE